MELTVTGKKEKINDAINKILLYMNSNLSIKADLTEYYKTLGLQDINDRRKTTATINYIFERRLWENKSSILQLALNDIQDLTQEEKNVITSLQNSINGVFELKKITPENFTLYNLINEKTYSAKILEKFSKFANLYTGNFLVCRIVELDNEYYIYHIVDNISLKNKVDAYRLAVLKIAQNPKSIYFDNNEKLEEIKNNIQATYQKFTNMFGSEYIITNNKDADALIEKINTFLEGNNDITKEKLENLIKEPEQYAYFDILDKSFGNDIFKSAQSGFSHHKEKYDVAILVDKDTGLNVLPLLGCFMKIFENENYNEIKDYQECVKAFIQNPRIPKKVLYMTYEKFPQTFIGRINEILEENFKTVEDIINKYRHISTDEGFSPTTTLYNSKAFRKLLEGLEYEEFQETKANYPKVGRNDPCPCGSGKKYKKCCGSAHNL